MREELIYGREIIERVVSYPLWTRCSVVWDGFRGIHARTDEGLTNFGGCAAVISHDRWFLDRVVTHILAFEGDSTVNWFEGNSRRSVNTDGRCSATRPTARRRIRFRPVRHQ